MAQEGEASTSASASSAIISPPTENRTLSNSNETNVQLHGDPTNLPDKGPSAPMSKNARKRMEKVQRMLASRPERRKLERERRKARRKVERQEEAQDRTPRMPQEPYGANVIIDLQWDNKMVPKEIVSLDAQLSHIYSCNRRSQYPVNNIILSSFHGQIEDRVTHVGGDRTKLWKGKGRLVFCDQPYTSFWSESSLAESTFKYDTPPFVPKEKMIYLTADSPNVLEAIDPSFTYIIGGIVDHNRCKDATIDRATEQGLQHAQLPIGPYLSQLNTRRVLTVNQVFDILIKWIEFKDWKTAFDKVIPMRKLDQKIVKSDSKSESKGANECNNNESESEEDEGLS